MRKAKEFFDKHQDEILEILRKHEVVQAYTDFTGEDSPYPILYVRNPHARCSRIENSIKDLYDRYDEICSLQTLTMRGLPEGKDLFVVQDYWTKLPLSEPFVQPKSNVSVTPMIINNEEESSYKGSEDHKRKHASVARKEKEGDVSTNQENGKVKENQTEEGEWVRRESNKRRRDCKPDANEMTANSFIK
jgi:hypothetical protein